MHLCSKCLLIFTLLIFFTNPLLAMKLKKEIDLKGMWRIKIGDNSQYANPDFNDSDWELIRVPSRWEDEGFPGYDGFAWYRISIEIPDRLKSKKLYVRLGEIDDVDAAYINGSLIGSEGEFPPKYKTAYNVQRKYSIPHKYIFFGKQNVLAVKVYDKHLAGGIKDDPVGIFSLVEEIKLTIDLNGLWKFSPGDNPDWANTKYDDNDWGEIKVPSIWEKQGYPRHDGFAWYRKKITLSDTLNDLNLILLLGKINDCDEVYFNGTRIGKTGEFPKKNKEFETQKNKMRAYFIPPYLIQKNQTNTIAVRVFDRSRTGGIYEGYIGITTRSEYLRYTKEMN